MIKVAWLHDHRLSEVPTGGAERTNQLVVSQAPKRVQVEVLNPNLLKEKSQLKSKDLIITNNIKWFNHTQLEWMLDCPRIRYEHDYWNLADSSHEQYKKEMWEGSVKMVFLSPAHYYEYRRRYPDIVFRDVVLQPSPIDVDKFHPGEKKPVCVYIGAVDRHKGILGVLTWGEVECIPVHVYGGGPLAGAVSTSSAGILMGTLGYEEVQAVLAEADVFIHLPEWVEPFGRAVMEARFAGCRIVTNNRLGAMSYDWWGEDTEGLRPFFERQGRAFWERVGLP